MFISSSCDSLYVTRSHPSPVPAAVPAKAATQKKLNIHIFFFCKRVVLKKNKIILKMVGVLPESEYVVA